MKGNFIKGLLFFFLATFWINSYAKLQQHSKLWNQAVLIGPVSKYHEKWKYYIDARLKLIDDKYKFEQARIYYGLGYQFTPDFASYLGAAYVVSDSTSGHISHENRVWEQINWDFMNRSTYTLTDRTRLEERKNTQFAQWAWRLREQITGKIPLKICDKHALMIYDEIFLNFNHPKWVSNHFIAENRVFIGIETTINKITSLDVGYLNQYQFDRGLTQRSNILSLSLNVRS